MGPLCMALPGPNGRVPKGNINGDGALEVVTGRDGAPRPYMYCPKALCACLHFQAPTFGDINGDGVLEVVVGSASGAVHALSGATGRDVANFPFRTRGRITARVLLARLRPEGGPRGLHAVVQSFDGHLYAIDGVTGAHPSLKYLDFRNEGL